MIREDDQSEEEVPTSLSSQLWLGIKIGLGILVGLPFLIFLVPIWFVYRWSEILAGRPDPIPPWTGIPWPFAKNRDRARPNQTAHPAPDQARTVREEQPEPAVNPAISMITTKSEPGTTKPVTPRRGVALVTGGGRRLGALICRDLAATGMTVAVAHHRSRVAAEALAAGIMRQGGQAAAFGADLRNPAHPDALVNEVENRLGPITLLINNAAIMLPTYLDGEATWEVMEGMFRVNLLTPMRLTMTVGRRMRQREGGVIINLADMWGERPLKGFAAYSASKAGLIMATRAFARELAPKVRVNAIAPGAILPPSEENPEDPFQRLLQNTPLAEHAGPNAILLAIRYLLDADYVTGEVLHPDGGRGLI